MPQPDPETLALAENLGRQIMGVLAPLLYEGLESGNKDMIQASKANIRMAQHGNPVFRQVLKKHLGLGLYTFVSDHPITQSRLVQGQWVEIRPHQLNYVVQAIRAMRDDFTAQIDGLLEERAGAIEEAPESSEAP